MRRSGFTLIEILFAIAILTIGGTSLIALFAHNLNLARRAREEVVINVIQRDVSVRNQIAAYTRGTVPFSDNSWLIDDIAAYDAMDNPRDTVQRRWADNPAYRGYNFWVKDFQRGDGGGDALWSAPNSESPTYGLQLYDAQFTDWDGYGLIWIDSNGDGLRDASEEIDFGLPQPSHRVRYDSRAMINYMKRLKGMVAWDLAQDVSTMAIADIMNGLENGNLGKWHAFYFTVYNPDTDKH